MIAVDCIVVALVLMTSLVASNSFTKGKDNDIDMSVATKGNTKIITLKDKSGNEVSTIEVLTKMGFQVEKPMAKRVCYIRPIEEMDVTATNLDCYISTPLTQDDVDTEISQHCEDRPMFGLKATGCEGADKASKPEQTGSCSQTCNSCGFLWARTCCQQTCSSKRMLIQ